MLNGKDTKTRLISGQIKQTQYKEASIFQDQNLSEKN